MTTMTTPTRSARLDDPAAQAAAVALLAQDEIFAAPTDTVYGLFCLPNRPAALARLYLAKDRPPEKAIPILIGEIDQLDQVALSPLPPIAATLMAELWPGALTLILPAQPHLPALLTAGGTTVAVRMPNHAGLCALLRQTGPLAATSANRSGGPDTHSAAEVLAQLAGRIPLLLHDDASGASSAALRSKPSTIVDLTPAGGPQILREGPLGEIVRARLAAV
jgi:L-threonylcarbamoyladenylate synthase